MYVNCIECYAAVGAGGEYGGLLVHDSDDLFAYILLFREICVTLRQVYNLLQK